jgi:hypothetical protein
VVRLAECGLDCDTFCIDSDEFISPPLGLGGVRHYVRFTHLTAAFRRFSDKAPARAKHRRAIITLPEGCLTDGAKIRIYFYIQEKNKIFSAL